MEVWQDIKGQIVYIKGSRLNKKNRLTREEFEQTKDLISGTVTLLNGTIFYAPFSKKNNP